MTAVTITRTAVAAARIVRGKTAAPRRTMSIAVVTRAPLLLGGGVPLGEVDDTDPNLCHAKR
jgi:hypothetical protein